MQLREAHRRVLVSAFRSIDATLREAESWLALRIPSPFLPYRLDLDDDERRAVTSQIADGRSKMLAGLARMGIATPPPSSSLRGAVATTLTFAEITLDDVGPKQLRGYGEIEDEAAAVVDQVLADLKRGFSTLHEFLLRDPTADVARRLARLAPDPIVDELKRVEAIVTKRGFVHLRGSLAALTERLETKTYEVAFFGRVSCGKSSLVNALLEQTLLPVGVTPVTAVPTKIVHDDTAGATVRFDDGTTQSITLAELGEFVTEQKNSDNWKKVRSVTARVRSPLLHQGVALVDTPGVGSLARAGSRAAYSYMPTCDLGVVVIDASGAVNEEDVETIRLLKQSGIPLEIVLSKADLVADNDRGKVESYVVREIASATALAVTPWWISNVAADGGSGRAWFQAHVKTLLADSKEQVDASIGKKLSQLRNDTIASLHVLATAPTRPSEPVSPTNTRVDTLASEAHVRLEQGRLRTEETLSTISSLLPKLVHAGARVVFNTEDGERERSERVARAFAEVTLDVRRRIAHEVTCARDDLAMLLTQMQRTNGGGNRDLPRLVVDFLSLPSLHAPTELFRRPREASSFPRIRMRLAERALAKSARPQLAEALRQFERALRSWVRDSVNGIERQFSTSAEPLRAHGAPRMGALSSEECIDADLATLDAP
jgi:small GTP-binding protein